mgnify:CR=1 FL=1
MVKTAKTVKRGSMLFNTVSDVVALKMILEAKNNQQKTTGAAIIRRTMSPEVI